MSTILDVKDLRKRFGGLVAVNGVTFSLAAGEVVGLLGPNGSGKSTVLNMISGALPTSGGKIQLAGKPISGMPPHRIAREGVARTFQLVRLAPSLSARENVLLALAYGRERHWGRAAERIAVDKLEAVGLEDSGEAPVDQLNYIDQKRVELARALATNPRLLLLDEWLAGLNPSELRTGIALIRTLKETGVAVLLVEHIMDAVRALCGRCIVMCGGNIIAEGETASVLSQEAVLSAYLGDDDA